MKKYLLFSTFVLVSVITKAQDNPYAIFGHEDNVTYNIHEPAIQVFHVLNADTTSEWQRIAFYVKTRIAKLYNRSDSAVHEFTFNPEEMFIWLSIDPLAGKYPPPLAI